MAGFSNKRFKSNQYLKTVRAPAQIYELADTLYAAITQLVECLAVNQNVTGSSPVGGVVFLLFPWQAYSQHIHNILYLIYTGFMWACSLARLERSAHNRAITGSNPVRPIPFCFLGIAHIYTYAHIHTYNL